MAAVTRRRGADPARRTSGRLGNPSRVLRFAIPSAGGSIVSDGRDDDGWWQGSDGQPDPPAQPPGPQQPLPPPPPGQDRAARIKANRRKARRRGCLTVVLIAAGIIALIAAIASVAGNSDDDPPEVAPELDGAGATTPAAEGAAGAADEIDDVGACTLADGDTVSLDVTNNSSEQSSYVIDVNYLDAAGQRVADETFFLNFLRPGEHAVEDSAAFNAAEASTCEIAEVDRFAAPSPDDVAEITCEVTGVDAIGDISTSLTATNNSSELSDYLISGSLVRDGVRIGTVTAGIENVQPGTSAPGEGFSVVAGPADGVSCEIVAVERTSSE
jgi:hypothetical protein